LKHNSKVEINNYHVVIFIEQKPTLNQERRWSQTSLVSIHESDFADIESDEIDQSDETSNDGKSCNNFEPGLDWHVRVWLVPKDSNRFLDQDFGSSRSQSPMPSLCMNVLQQQVDDNLF
jgi:hypothetical protein